MSYFQLNIMCIFMMFPILQKECGGISDLNNKAVKNVRFHCRFSFSDILYVVAALYSPFQTCMDAL